MSMGNQGIAILMGQRRWAMAAGELRKRLASEPDDGHAHALLGICLLEQEDVPGAEREAKEAVRLEPEDALGYEVLGLALLHRGRLREARKATMAALQLSPHSANLHAQMANIELRAEDRKAALDWAQRGLALDPEHDQCSNLRALVLTQSGRADDAHEQITESLRRDPENALTHANRGWALLHQNRPKEALVHFREALRIDPGHEFAKAGLVEALKARNPIYRLLLGYFLWMARLSPRTRTAVILGGYVGYQVLRGVSRNQPDLAPYIWPVLGVYIGFCVLTWVAMPMFNLLLRLSPYGRHALNRRQTVASNWFGGLIAAALLAVVAGLVSGELLLHLTAGYFALLALMASSIFGDDPHERNALQVVCAVACAVTGAAALVVAGFNLPWGGGTLVLIFWLAFAGFMFSPLVRRSGG